MKIPKTHRGPHKMPSRATCEPRVWDPWLRRCNRRNFPIDETREPDSALNQNKNTSHNLQDYYNVLLACQKLSWGVIVNEQSWRPFSGSLIQISVCMLQWSFKAQFSV